LLKSIILVFPALVGLQGISKLIRCAYTLTESQDTTTPST